MTASSQIRLSAYPLFERVTPEQLEQLEAAVEIVRFAPGQLLSEAHFISNRVFVVVEGVVRVLARDEGRLRTLHKSGPGTVVGLASLLRGQACEEVSAAGPLLAAALPDRLLIELLQTSPAFQTTCNSTVFPAELAALLAQLKEQGICSGALGELLRQTLPEARIVQPAADTTTENGWAMYLSSNQTRQAGAAAGVSEPSSSSSESNPQRWIALPKPLLEQLAAEAPHTNQTEASQQQDIGLPDHNPVVLQRSALELGANPADTGIQLIQARGNLEETLACFQMLAASLKLPFRRDAIERILRESIDRGQAPSLQLCGQIAANLGLHVMGVTVAPTHAGRLQTPALVPWDQSYALVVRSDASGLRVAVPSAGWLDLDAQAIAERYPQGIPALLIERTTETKTAKFNLSWFLPAIQQHRAALIQVLAASFVVQLFTLANPLLIQVIIDKVISQRSMDTLQILGYALLAVTVLEGLLGGLRTFLFTETTNRIDIRLGAEVIDHLLRLPLGYFDRRPVGELASRISELEKIRNFLTGQALTAILDSAFAVIYIVVMVMYSWVLTLVALGVLPIQLTLTAIGSPLFRRQLRRASEENANTQSHLVEVLTGIQTVKAQNVEMVSRWRWQESYGRYISRSFEKTITGVSLTEVSQVLQKLSQLLVLWVGASLVLDGTMSLGQLIAFRIISSYVTQPMLRLTTLWQNIQELKVSFERLSDIVDTPEESDEADKGKTPLPSISGSVEFKDVTFSFAKGQPPVLRHIQLEIPTGTFVGVVGQSGSGKSTLMKLLSRLYNPDEGRILIDGTDIAKVELYSLRRQIGIVPQEPLLFSGTVAENIAIAKPDASNDEIVAAARLACAHDFVMELPSGYSTPVGERGAGLSGGQRQRIAIARTLLSRPKLLIMDEATSALDYDTERRVCDNLLESLQHCTVFFITHRLSTIRRADRILMLDQGALVESGTHDQLIQQRGRYFALYRQQEAAA
jgi:ATP-binding cassette subfamily B protein